MLGLKSEVSSFSEQKVVCLSHAFIKFNQIKLQQ